MAKGTSKEKAQGCCCASSSSLADLSNDDSLKTTIRNSEEKKKLINRLNRIEGQLRGIKNMLEEDRYCIDIINQTVAVNSAINSFTKELLTRHISSCVKEDVASGNSEKLDELITTLQKLMK